MTLPCPLLSGRGLMTFLLERGRERTGGLWQDLGALLRKA